jgi:heavy metal translocating P-type ATPase
MALSLGLNIANLQADNPAYPYLHGLLIASCGVVCALLGGPLVRGCTKNLLRGRLTLEALFLTSLCGALVASGLSTYRGSGPVYYEVVAIVLFIYTLGKTLSGRSYHNMRSELQRLRQTFDHAYLEHGALRSRVPLAEMDAETVVSVLAGEPITVDGYVVEGQSFVQETTLTGEPTPVLKHEGDKVLAGSYALDGALRVKPQALVGKRYLDYILETLDKAPLQGSSLQRQADHIVQWFLPLVTLVAVGTFWGWQHHVSGHVGLFHAMSVLLVACPCAFGLATPIAVWSGLLRLASWGIVAKGGTLIDVLARVTHVVLDKTGTLSQEALQVVGWWTLPQCPVDMAMLQALVGALESRIHHPIAKALQHADPQANLAWSVKGATSVAGKGVAGTVTHLASGRVYEVAIGNGTWVEQDGTRAALAALEALVPTLVCPGLPQRLLYIRLDGQWIGAVALAETLREDTLTTLEALKEMGLSVAILTGDPHPQWAQLAGITLCPHMSPQDKCRHIQACKSQGAVVLYVGDGLNDAPAMHQCDGSLALGHSVPLTLETATATLRSHSLLALPSCIRLARHLYATVRRNLRFALGYNAVGMALAAGGWLTPLKAALIMLVSSLWVSLQALRATQAVGGQPQVPQVT